jgi:hypothetical protein
MGEGWAGRLPARDWDKGSRIGVVDLWGFTSRKRGRKTLASGG